MRKAVFTIATFAAIAASTANATPPRRCPPPPIECVVEQCVHEADRQNTCYQRAIKTRRHSY